MPAQMSGPGALLPWAHRMAALAAAPPVRDGVTDRAAGAGTSPPARPLTASLAPSFPASSSVALSRAQRRAARRSQRRTAASGSARVGGLRVTGPVVRGAAVLLTAGMLVGGDLATTRAVGYGGASGTILPSATERAHSAEVARLQGQANASARSSRAETVALAAAALRAAHAARPLVSDPDADGVRTELAGAVERLATLLDDARPAPRMSADLPTLPARRAAPLLTAPPATPAPTPGAAGAAQPGAPEPGADGTGSPAEAVPAPEPIVVLPELPDLEPLTPVHDPAAADDDVHRTDDAAADDEDAADPDDPTTADDDTDHTAVPPADTADAGGTATPADPAAPATDPAADVAAPGAEAAAAPEATAPLPAADAAPGAVLTGPALTAELDDAASAVFQLSMELESLASEARRDEAIARVEALTTVETAAAAAGEAVTELGALEALTPLTEEERRALRSDEGDLTTGTTSQRARLREGTPAGVTALMQEWENGRIPADALCAVPFATSHRLQCDAADALADLNEAYREAFGTDLAVVSSYRTLEAQVSLRASKGGLAARPGTSNHGWGIAVDLGGIGSLGDFSKPGYKWLQEHAGEFGWNHPRGMEPGGSGPQEPWHWEFGTA